MTALIRCVRVITLAFGLAIVLIGAARAQGPLFLLPMNDCQVEDFGSRVNAPPLILEEGGPALRTPVDYDPPVALGLISQHQPGRVHHDLLSQGLDGLAFDFVITGSSSFILDEPLQRVWVFREAGLSFTSHQQ